MERGDYRFTNSASMHVEGSTDRKAVLDVLQPNYCDTITDATLKEIGVYQKRDAIWIVVATPFVTPGVKDTAQVSKTSSITRECGSWQSSQVRAEAVCGCSSRLHVVRRVESGRADS